MNVAMMTWSCKANGGNINLVPQNTLMQPAGYISSTVQRKTTLEPCYPSSLQKVPAMAPPLRGLFFKFSEQTEQMAPSRKAGAGEAVRDMQEEQRPRCSWKLRDRKELRLCDQAPPRQEASKERGPSLCLQAQDDYLDTRNPSTCKYLSDVTVPSSTYQPQHIPHSFCFRDEEGYWGSRRQAGLFLPSNLGRGNGCPLISSLHDVGTSQDPGLGLSMGEK